MGRPWVRGWVALALALAGVAYLVAGHHYGLTQHHPWTAALALLGITWGLYRTGHERRR